ncbi:gamma-glutamylcyclotransferase family protein [Agrobacterium vitis]|uniref:gamma-glutamylcyclotransferase family protein n=1 Tax=Agrobacterium vitis TaxID=373 RepID=UPI0022A7EB42|nr:gamma-glutamylcyclotransferase family protein [Agrobacterium vitis]
MVDEKSITISKYLPRSHQPTDLQPIYNGLKIDPSPNNPTSQGLAVLYFAYGSNMDATQMKARCPDARVVGLASLNGHVLCFPRRSKTRGCGVSSILAKDGCETWGVIYELSDADLVALDRNEGYRQDRDPSNNAYNRITVSVKLDGKRIDAETYVASRQEGVHPPNAGYLAHIRDGAAHHGLPAAYLEYLAGLPHEESAKS